MTDVPDVTAGAGLAAWEEWLDAWERFLSDVVTFSTNPSAGVAPQTPTLPQPAGPAPVDLRARLARAGAVRDQAIGDLTGLLGQRRRWQPSSTTPSGSRRVVAEL